MTNSILFEYRLRNDIDEYMIRTVGMVQKRHDRFELTEGLIFFLLLEGNVVG